MLALAAAGQPLPGLGLRENLTVRPFQNVAAPMLGQAAGGAIGQGDRAVDALNPWSLLGGHQAAPFAAFGRSTLPMTSYGGWPVSSWSGTSVTSPPALSRIR